MCAQVLHVASEVVKVFNNYGCPRLANECTILLRPTVSKQIYRVWLTTLVGGYLALLLSILLHVESEQSDHEQTELLDDLGCIA